MLKYILSWPGQLTENLPQPTFPHYVLKDQNKHVMCDLSKHGLYQ